MKVNTAAKDFYDIERVPVSFRLSRELVEALRDFCATETWPPPPTQTEIVTKGIELVLRELKSKRGKSRA